jgi:polysaccharide biosynthesis transport protein
MNFAKSRRALDDRIAGAFTAALRGLGGDRQNRAAARARRSIVEYSMFEAPRQFRSAALADAAAAPPPADLDLGKIWSTVWQGRTTILAATAVALLVAVLFVLAVPHRFTAVTEILIEPTDLHALVNQPTQPAQVSDTAVLQVESQVRVLTSEDVLRRVVESADLAHDPEFVRQSPLRAVANELLALLGVGKRLTPADPSLAALIELKRHLQVRRAERTYVVDVSVNSRDPAKAARLANAIARAYLAEQTEVRSDAARQISQSLGARLAELKESVRRAEDRVQAFKESHNIVGASGQLVNEQQLSDLNNQLAGARARTASAKARLDQIDALQRSKTEIGAFAEAVQSPTITALRTQYAEVMRREAEQTTSLGARHPAVIEIQAQAERLKHMIGDEINRTALAARTDYDSAKANEELLTKNVETLKQSTLATNADMVTLRELERDVQASRAVYEAFLVRARETGEQERLDTKNIQVISRAEAPPNRSWPPSNTVIALGAVLLGIAAGAGIALMRTVVPGMAPLPRRAAPAPRKRSLWRDKSPAAAAELAPGVPVLAVMPRADDESVRDIAENPGSRLARAMVNVYDAVRASPGRRGNPSILVVASREGIDTATVALMLAAFAAATQRVLLIDTDLERRTLSTIDADRGDAGLVDVATGRRLLSEAVVRDRTTNINLIPFVAPGSRRERRITDDDVKLAFAQTKDFDMVIVAATDLSRDPSAGFFAHLVDHIVLVSGADEGDAKAIATVVARLGLDARKVRGAVLTEEEAA